MKYSPSVCIFHFLNFCCIEDLILMKLIVSFSFTVGAFCVPRNIYLSCEDTFLIIFQKRYDFSSYVFFHGFGAIRGSCFPWSYWFSSSAGFAERLSFPCCNVQVPLWASISRPSYVILYFSYIPTFLHIYIPTLSTCIHCLKWKPSTSLLK